jgi:hypothetical protein
VGRAAPAWRRPIQSDDAEGVALFPEREKPDGQPVRRAGLERRDPLQDLKGHLQEPLDGFPVDVLGDG